MPSKLYDLMHGRRAELVESLAARLHASTAPHYRAIPEDQLHSRSARLVDAFLDSTGGDPTPFVSYVRRMTEERISEGYFLDEIQLAFSLLEEKAWSIVTSATPLEGQVPQLARITATLGGAKDAISRIYLQRQQSCEARVRQLEAELARLFQGTDAAPEVKG